MEKLDVKKSLDCYRARHGEFRILEVPEQQYLMIDGHGDPNGPALAEAVEALYPLAYTLKFASKRALELDYVVPPLEGLWWADDMESFTVSRNKEQWDWTLMLMVPEWIDRPLFERATEQVEAKGATARHGDIRLSSLAEGLCVQVLHLGSFDEEGPILDRLHREFIPSNGLRMVGRHHEIYLSDARRVAPEKRRTILRQPVVPA